LSASIRRGIAHGNPDNGIGTDPPWLQGAILPENSFLRRVAAEEQDLFLVIEEKQAGVPHAGGVDLICIDRGTTGKLEE
jgi:hypothetical protein